MVLGNTTTDIVTFTGKNITFNEDLNATGAGVQGANVNATGVSTFGDASDDTVGGGTARRRKVEIHHHL